LISIGKLEDTNQQLQTPKTCDGKYWQSVTWRVPTNSVAFCSVANVRLTVPYVFTQLPFAFFSELGLAGYLMAVTTSVTSWETCRRITWLLVSCIATKSIYKSFDTSE
jgi:hypothetical protein